jgi:hypothetical protein
MSSAYRKAQEHVAAYYESNLRGLIEHVGAALDRHRVDGDAERMDSARAHLLRRRRYQLVEKVVLHRRHPASKLALHAASYR